MQNRLQNTIKTLNSFPSLYSLPSNGPDIPHLQKKKKEKSVEVRSNRAES